MSSKLDILKMIEMKKITVEEGLELIEALEQTEKIEDDVREEKEISPNNKKHQDKEKYAENESEIEKEIYTSGNTVLQNFDVALTTCKINIERSNVDEVTVEIFDDKTRQLINKPEWLHFYEEENYISIKETRVTSLSDVLDFFKSGSSMFGSVFINVKIPLNCSVDKGKFSSVSGSVSLIGIKGIDIEAKSVSGKIYVADIKAKLIQLKSTSGNVVADEVKAARAYYKTTSGKIKVTGEQYFAECKSVSGSVDYVGGKRLEQLIASTVSGKIMVSVPDPETFNLNFDTLSGGIDTSGFAIIDKSTSGKKKVVINNRSESKNIKCNSVSGKIVLDKR